MRFILAIVIMFALPVQAQEMSSDYEVVGYVDLTMDGEASRLPVIVNLVQEWSFAKSEVQNVENNISRITIVGVTPGEDGQWQFPMIEFSVQSNTIAMFQGIYISYSLEPFRNDYAFAAGTRYETAKIENLVMGEDGLIEFDFSGQLTHYDRDPETAETTPQAGKDLVKTSGRVSVVVPGAYRN